MLVNLLIRMLIIVVISDLAICWVIKKQLKPLTRILIFIAIFETIAIIINLWWVLVYKG
jgi:hypothetical protein